MVSSLPGCWLLAVTFLLLFYTEVVAAEVTVTSNVEVGNGLHLARLGQSVTFECQVMDAFQLDWIAEPVLNSTDPIRFFSGDLINRTIQREHFTGVLTNRSTSSSNTLLATMTVTLSFEARDAFYGIIFLCTDGLSNSSGILFLSATSGAQITFNMQYMGRGFACLNQSVSFECQVTDAVQLELIVQHVIPSSDPIRFFSSDDMGRNVTRGQFIGTLTSLFTSLSDVQRANMTSTLRFVAIGSLDGSLVECRSDTSRVANILQVAEITPQPTGFTCLEAPVFGPSSTTTVQCTWEVPTGGSSSLFFIVRVLPDRIEDVIPSTQTSYSFNLSCEGGAPWEATISSNCNNVGVPVITSASRCRDLSSTGKSPSRSLAPVAAAVILLVIVPLVIFVIITVLLMPHHFKATNKERLKELAASNPSAQQPKLEEDNIELLDMGKLLYRISWTVWWKSADQLVTVYQDGSDSKTTETTTETTTRCQYSDWSCQPGSQYKVSVRTESACCMPFKRREKFFLTEVKLVLYPSGNVETVLNHFTPEDEGLVTCRYECGQDQRIKETYKRVQTNTQATVYERVVSNTSSTGTERFITIPFTRRNESGEYQIVLETLPIMASTCVLNHPKVEVVFNVTVKVLPRIPQDLDYTDNKHHSVKLCWEQEYRNEDEEPSEYHVTVAEEAELCGPIVPTVSKLSSAKYMYTCEYTLRGLKPGKSYTVGITVNNMDGAVHSDEVTIVTTPPPPKPTIERTTATTADIDCELRNKKSSEIYTLVICSVTGEEVTRKQLKGKCGRENVSIDRLDPDMRYTAYLSARLETDSELAVDGTSISFTTTADICSFTVNPTRPELGAEVQFTASYQVNLNNVDVFCIIPDGKSLPPCGTSVPDDKSVVKATFVVADARSGKYTVSIASFLPGDKTYPIKKSTAVKSLKVTCSVPTDSSLDVTVPEKMVTSVSAEIQWMIHIHPNLFADSHAKLVVNPEAQMTVTSTHYMKELDSINGSFEFPNLQPSTSYCASLIITYPGVKDPVTKKMDPFKTKGKPAQPLPPVTVSVTVNTAVLKYNLKPIKNYEECSIIVSNKGARIHGTEVNKGEIHFRVSPLTKYKAKLRVQVKDHPEFFSESLCETFKSPDYEYHIMEYATTAQLTVNPPPPDGATLVVNQASTWTQWEKSVVPSQSASSVNVISFDGLVPDTKHFIYLHIDEVYLLCGYFSTPKMKKEAAKKIGDGGDPTSGLSGY